MGKLAQIKTKPTDSSVEGFINKVDNEQKRKDCFTIVQLMEKATKDKPKMWGSSIIGFGDMRYKSPATGREVDWFIIGGLVYLQKHRIRSGKQKITVMVNKEPGRAGIDPYHLLIDLNTDNNFRKVEITAKE